MSHQVFIERCRDSSPAASEALANAVAARYQIDPQQILARLRSGRFRVKANLTVDAARDFVQYLEANGALCSIVSESGEVIERSVDLSSTILGRPAVSAQLPLHTPAPPEDVKDSPPRNVGEGQQQERVNVFLPPEAMSSQGPIELAESSLDDFIPNAAPAVSEVLPEEQEVEELLPPKPSPARRALVFVALSSRAQFALGVFLVFVAGFTTSSLAVSGMERGRYDNALIELRAAYAAVDSVDSWSQLEGLRGTTLKSLERGRTNVIITSLIVWLLVSGLLMFLWTRFIDWDRIREFFSIEAEFL